MKSAELLAQRAMLAFKDEMKNSEELRCAVLLIAGKVPPLGVGIASRLSDPGRTANEAMMVMAEGLLGFALATTEPIGACLRLASVFMDAMRKLIEEIEREESEN